MTKLVALQHLLPSLLWLLKQTAASDDFMEIDLLTKEYSMIASVKDKLPQKVTIKTNVNECFASNNCNFLIVDEGGYLHQSLPLKQAPHTTGVEQTTSGLRGSWNYPTVLVCRAAAKLIFESQIIARGIIRKLESLDLLNGNTIGIIGLGALGASLARNLLAMGVETFGSEIRTAPSDIKNIVVTLPELLCNSDVVLGCTGIDVLAGVELKNFSGNKIFASCSSYDIEFNSLLRKLPPRRQFNTIKGEIGQLRCTILNGGFPINFDRKREWESFEEILLTRKLVLTGISQAKKLIGTNPRGIMLNPEMQLKIVQSWLDEVPNPQSLWVPEPLTEKFFRDYSEGEIEITPPPRYTLHNTTPTVLQKMRSHKKPYSTDIHGLPILVLPNVWSPAYDWSSLFHIENIPNNIENLDVLEIGCGTGVISIFLNKARAKRIVAVDINPEAIHNTELNFERFNIENGEVLLSDGFKNVSGKFDLITWNAPYHGCKPNDMLERGCADENYKSLKKFFSQVRSFLKPKGEIIFGFSESGDIELLESLISLNGFRIYRKLSDWRQNYNCILYYLSDALPDNKLHTQ